MITTKRNGRDQINCTYVDYVTELDFKSGLDESLRYTKRGYRRTDEEILGIMKIRRQKKAARAKKLKLDRKIRAKAQTLLMKRLRGSGFEELNEGDFYNSIQVEVSDDILATSPICEGKSEKQLRREQHALVMAANAKNKLAKKNRKLSKRKVNSPPMDSLPVSEADEDTYIMASCNLDDLKDILYKSHKQIEFVCAMTPEASELMKKRGYALRPDSSSLWYNVFDEECERAALMSNAQFISQYSKSTNQRLTQIPEMSEREFHEMDASLEEDSEEEKVEFDQKAIDDEYEQKSFELSRELIDKTAKVATLSISPDVLGDKINFRSLMDNSLVKWIHAKTNDYYTLQNVDLVVSLIDALWLLSHEPNRNRRIGIMHLWLGGLGLDIELKWAFSVLSAFVFTIVDTPSQVVAESLSEDIEGAVSFIKKVHNTAFVTAVRDLFVSVAALRLFPKAIALNVYHYLGKPRESNMMELSFIALEGLARVIRVAELLLSGVKLSTALFTENPVETAKSTARTLLAHQENLYTGLPVEGKMCQREWVVACSQVLPLLTKIMETSNPYKSGYRELQDLVIKLSIANSSVRSRVAGSSRIPPFCIVLHGEPGIGKSTLMNFLFRIHSDVKKRVFDESHVFHRIVSSDYWEGYDPFSHPYVHYSELGNKNAQLVRTQGDEVINELTSVIDSLPMPLNMAFGDKGKSFFLGEMIVIDTNNPGMNLDILFSNPSAFRRRFIYIKPTVREEFRKEGSCGIDYEKSKNQRLVDKYTFNCYVKREVDVKTSETVDLVKGGSVDDLYDKLFVLMRDRIAMETELLKLKSADRDTKYGSVAHEADFNNDVGGLKNAYDDAHWVPCFKGDEPYKREEKVNIVPEPVPKVSKAGFFCQVFTDFLNLGQSCFDYVAMEAALKIKPTIKTEYFETYFDSTCFIILLILLTVCPSIALTLLYCVIWFNSRRKIVPYLRNQSVEKVRCEKMSRVQASYSLLIDNFNGDLLTRFTPYAYRAFCVVAASGALYVLCRAVYDYFIKKQSEDHTEFKNESDSNSVLNYNEDLIGSTFSQKRIAGKTPEAWAIRTLHHPIVANGEVSSLSKSCNGNLRFCILRHGSKTTRVCVFGICNNFAVIPTHALPDEDFEILVSTTPYAAESCYKSTMVDRSMMVNIGNDMTVISLSQLQFRNILSHVNNVNFTVLDGRIATTDTAIKSVQKLYVSNPKGNYYVDKACQYKWPDHKVGFCGMPVYGRVNGGPFILGLHCAGKIGTSDAYAALFDVDALRNAIDTLKSKQGLMTPVSQADFKMEFTDPGHKSPFRYVNLHNVEYFGSDGKPVIMPKDSILTKTKIHDDVDNIFKEIGVDIVEQFAPPLMRPKVINGEYISPQNINLVKINTQKKALDRRVLATIVDHFVNRVVSELSEVKVDSLRPLTFQEAINGAPQDAFLRRINPSTGAGYGFKGKKRAHLPLVHEELREPTAELKKIIQERQAEYFNDESRGVIYGAKLKDEPRALAKVKKGKTRMFYPAPVDYLVVCRQVLAPLFTLMVEHRNIFNMSVGINMHSEGEAFYKRFASFADSEDCLFDGDYGGFDTSMPYDIGLAASTIVVKLCERLGYNEHALKLVRGVMSDSLFPIIELNSDVFRTAGLMTSGGYGTAEFNCIRNNVLMMYYFATTPGLTLHDFDTQFCKSTYGDDVTGVVKLKIQHLFNNVLYAKFCEEVYGMEFTTPDKKVSEVPLRKLNQLSFLKRNFVPHPQFGKVMAVLDYESIAKSLKWMLPSESISSIDQIIATANSALWEMFLHLDQSRFEKFRSLLISTISARYAIELDSKDFNATFDRICRTLCPEAMELREEETLPISDGVIELTLCEDVGSSDF